MTAQQFFEVCKATLDELLAEGGKMMTVGLHPRISGHPGRAKGLRRFLEYVVSDEVRDKVWIATRSEIAEFWKQTFPPSNAEMTRRAKL